MASVDEPALPLERMRDFQIKTARAVAPLLVEANYARLAGKALAPQASPLASDLNRVGVALSESLEGLRGQLDAAAISFRPVHRRLEELANQTQVLRPTLERIATQQAITHVRFEELRERMCAALTEPRSRPTPRRPACRPKGSYKYARTEAEFVEKFREAYRQRKKMFPHEEPRRDVVAGAMGFRSRTQLYTYMGYFKLTYDDLVRSAQ